LTGGHNELGVLLYGHRRNAYWFGSRLSLAHAKRLAPLQNATILQVTSAVLAGMAWAVANPRQGLVEVEELDFAFCLRHQSPYLGELFGAYTNWQPPARPPNGTQVADPWQFSNVRV
jgi:homospermidine synthase